MRSSYALNIFLRMSPESSPHRVGQSTDHDTPKGVLDFSSSADYKLVTPSGVRKSPPTSGECDFGLTLESRHRDFPAPPEKSRGSSV